MVASASTVTFRRAAVLWLLGMLAATSFAQVQVQSVAWEQVEPSASFTLAVERAVYVPQDLGGRVVLAVQAGRGQTPATLTARWSITHAEKPIHQGTAALADGMAVIDFELASLTPGEYAVQAELFDGEKSVERKQGKFTLRAGPQVATSGRVPLIVPTGIQADDAGFAAPLTFGVPFPKGALADISKVRVVDAAGQPVPAQLCVRGKWDYHENASIRWLGVDLQSSAAPAWWPDRQQTPYFLEFGDQISATPVAAPLTVREVPNGLRIDTGAIAFTVHRQGFNLIDEVVDPAGQTLLTSGKTFGPYLVDHEGAVYRAAEDRQTELTIEEQGPLRVVVRAAGWYVKEGTTGEQQSYTLPTERLCRFVTRIEAYRGLPSVRVLHTWIITYDSYTVRLRDMGLALPTPGAQQATFDVLDGEPIAAAVPAQGVRLIQHRHHRFAVETGAGQVLHEGEKSAGNAYVTTPAGTLGVSLRELWQRFPKEIEALPGELRLHVWPAHGRTDPSIDPYAPARYHQLWFAHQGSELDLKFPWESLFTVMKLADDPSTGIYHAGGTAMGGVHASAMGAAITSDILLTFSPAQSVTTARQLAARFQQQPHALAHPDWLASSGALGPVHPYDPENFGPLEDVARRTIRAYTAIQDYTEEFGMFLYRLWHHNGYDDHSHWNPYRLYSAGHHYEPYMPWLYYARSGDPDYYDLGVSTGRQVTDLALIHHADERYPHQEFWSRQVRVLGSTRHTNGFVAWGGDHALLGHLTTYNGHLLWHYLTGDLRVREILVTQWQHSLLDDRSNKNLPMRLGVGRDNNNALGELIDLYQLTYDPRLLAYIGPCVERFYQDQRVWGLPLQNLLYFSGDPHARQQLLEAVAARRQDAKSNLHNSFLGHSPAGIFALASLQDPGQGWATDALVLSNLGLLTRTALTLEARDRMALCAVPDDLLYLPRVMAAVTSEQQNPSGGKLGKVVGQQVLPIGGSNIDRNRTRCIVRQATDGPFTIEVKGVIREPGIPLDVLAPDGQVVLHEMAPPGPGAAYTVPADGQTGDYVIFLGGRDVPRDHIMAPLTDLPQEVYVMGYWSQATATRFFTKRGNQPGGPVSLKPHASPGSLLSADLRELLASTDGKEPMEAAVPADGLWVDTRGVYQNLPNKTDRLILALDPARWFEPTPEALAVEVPQ